MGLRWYLRMVCECVFDKMMFDGSLEGCEAASCEVVYGERALRRGSGVLAPAALALIVGKCSQLRVR